MSTDIAARTLSMSGSDEYIGRGRCFAVAASASDPDLKAELYTMVLLLLRLAERAVRNRR
jgi:hypothetical protein